GAGALVLTDIEPLWTGDLVASNLARPSAVPTYWQHAADYLDSQGSGTRVLGVPGEDFAAYRWGITEDPVLPGLMSRPYAARQVVPQGEPGSVDLLAALDESIQDGVFDPSTLAPLARLMSAGQILVQSDLQYERYSLPLPAALWQQLTPPPPGTSAGPTFGAAAPTPVIRFPLLNETRLGLPTGSGDPPPLAVLDVPEAPPIVRAQGAGAPMIVSGNGQGLVDAAAAGLLGGNPSVFYSASYDHDPSGLAQLMAQGADLVVTDTNAKQAWRWGGLQDNRGYVEQPTETPLVPDPSDQPLVVVPGQDPTARTTTQLQGVASVRASAYGNPLTYTPEDRPDNAVDGDPTTAWKVAAFSDAVGQKLQVQLQAPVTTDHVTLLQPPGGNRTITKVGLSFDGGAPMTVDLGPASLAGVGQAVTFPARSFSTLTTTILATTDDGGSRRLFDGLSGVGLSEVGIPGVNLSAVVQMPTDLTRMAGAASAGHELVLLMTRNRAPDVPPRTDPEVDMARTFSVPTTRTFALTGTARISAKDPDTLIDSLLGAGPGGSGDPIVSASSTTRLPGDRAARADAAVDGNGATAWTAAFGPQSGQSLSYRLARPLTFDHLDLQVVNDGEHSLPRRITVSAGGSSRTIDLPALPSGAGRPHGSVSPVHLTFPALTGASVELTVDTAQEISTLDYYAGNSNRQDILPVALAEIGLPGASRAAAPAQVPVQCRSDLVTVDGRPVSVEITGSGPAAVAGQGLAVTLCGASAGGLTLSAGPHVLRTSPSLPSGWEIDQVALTSPTGAPGPAPAAGAGSGGAPSVSVTHQDRTHVTAALAQTTQPFWFVLGESMSRGWKAEVTSGGRTVDLGAPRLIDGYANGWYV
ncbi:MAG TPA: alpha-(1-_3)-arabinofuranosyltransferase family protein, partial [Acidimicrobiales bacterium]|nr:alpha-(1->3)-arabinofuranosyltransferase family protein [Acidimicrobiales bacterium]